MDHLRSSHFAIACGVTVILLMASSIQAYAEEPFVLSGFGTAATDGVMGPEEWSNAASFDFQADLPPADGGGTTPATLFVMNDETNLYLGVKVMRNQLNKGELGFGLDQVAFEFDNNNSGGASEEGDDALLISPGLHIFGLASFFDEVRTRRPPCPQGVGYCGFLDVQLSVPGTNDGAGAATNNGAFSFFEISHPLNSLDDMNDFSLRLGSTVGFFLAVNLSSVHPFCVTGCSAGTPSPLPGPGGGADITISGPPAIRVDLDILTGSAGLAILPGAGGKIPVAILSSSTFDAFVEVNVSSLTFGRTGSETSLVFCNGRPVDVNHDGLGDLLCHFDLGRTNFEPEDTAATLKGQTVDGTAIEGTSAIRIAP